MTATAVQLVQWAEDGLLAAVEYGPDISVTVRWHEGRSRPWRCSACGTQTSPPRCGHARAVDLTLRAQEALRDCAAPTTTEATTAEDNERNHA